MLSALVMTAVLSAAPTQYAYQFDLKGARVGAVVLDLDEPTYRYASVQVLNRDGEVSRRRRRDFFELSTDKKWRGSVPATLALVTMSNARGCVDVIEEVTRRTGTFCVTALSGQKATGTLLGKQVNLVLSEGVASEVSFPADGSRFVRVKRVEEPNAPPDFTASGFRIPGDGPLVVAPPVGDAVPHLEPIKEQDARRWMKEVHAEGHLFCIEYARAFAKRAGEGRAAVVHGLRIDDDGDRAYPHAWVRVVTEHGPLSYDPTYGEPTNAARYLPLVYVTRAEDEQTAGALWLSFINGSRTVSRGQPR